MTNRIDAKRNTVTAARDDTCANDFIEHVSASEVGTNTGGQDAAAVAPDEALGAASGEASADDGTGLVGRSLPMSRPSRKRRKKPETAAPAAPRISKTEAALKLLRRKTGASLAELQEATGWQAHSVRGFLSGTVRKKLSLSSEVTKQGVRRYRIAADAKVG